MHYRWFGFGLVLACYLAVPALALAQSPDVASTALAQAPDDELKVYAVNVVTTPPFEKQVNLYGVYLGQGFVLTAAHVVGSWPFITRPHVLVAGQDLAANVIKLGSFEQTDLALLSVDETKLPISLRLRRNPLCTEPPKVGMEIVDVIPEKVTPLQVISPLLIPAPLRKRFDTLMTRPQISGSGIFDAERKCLLGIVSAKVTKYSYQFDHGWFTLKPDGFAGYFVSAAKIVEFFPQDFHY